MSTASQASPIVFPHRRNPNGTFDSICPHCYRTIATEKSEYRLAEAEQTHRCFPDTEIKVHRA
jgi:hypothetical protein